MQGEARDDYGDVPEFFGEGIADVPALHDGRRDPDLCDSDGKGGEIEGANIQAGIGKRRGVVSVAASDLEDKARAGALSHQGQPTIEPGVGEHRVRASSVKGSGGPEAGAGPPRGRPQGLPC